MLLADWGNGDVLLSMIWFFLLFVWIWLLVAIFADVFRSHDLSGWSKALWCIFVIVLPFLGVFAYVIARGNKMGQHAMETAQNQDAAAREYIRNTVAADGSTADELSKLADLKARGVIDDAEFFALKAKVVA